MPLRLLSSPAVNLLDRPTWIKVIGIFRSWILQTSDLDAFIELCRLNVTLLQENEDEDIWTSHPFMTLYFHLMKYFDFYPSGTIEKVFQNIPVLSHASLKIPRRNESVDYQLLVDEIPIQVNQFFRWRQHLPCTVNDEGFPNFSNLNLCSQYGNRIEMIDWTLYLQVSRPLRAFLNLQSLNGIKDSGITFYPSAILAVALEDPWNNSRVQTCVLLIEMLGYDSYPLRLCISVLDSMLQSSDHDRKELTNIGRNMLTNVPIVSQLTLELEKMLLKSCHLKDLVSFMFDCRGTINFANLFEVALPDFFSAYKNNLLIFILFIQHYDYPLEQLAYDIFRSPLKLHMQLAMHTVSPPSTASPESFYHILIEAFSKKNPASLIESSLNHRSVELAVLSAVLESEHVFSSLCLYLYLHLLIPKTKTEEEEEDKKLDSPLKFSAKELNN